MFAHASQSSSLVPQFVRARGAVEGRFERAGTTTRLIDSFETGGLRLRIPNSSDGCDAVVLNTAGGMAGGDEWRLSFGAGRKSRVRLTTQSAEKIYRTDNDATVISTDLSIGDGAHATWVPQETILFDGSRLERTLTVEMAENATAVLLEMTVFGRVARGERLRSAEFHDRWRVRRGPSLIFAEDIRLTGDVSEIMQKPAAGQGATAVATLLYVSQNAEKSLNLVRAVLEATNADCGASAWNGMLLARFAGGDPFEVRGLVARVLQRLSRRDLPKVWSI
jgi:urease accessory protein